MSVFITGASSGLGEALAVRYAAAGHTLGLLGRRADALHALAARLPGEHHVYALDVRDRRALHTAARHFEQAAGTVDIVIASAGVSAGTLTGEPDDFDVFAEIFSTNVFATMATFEPFIAGMALPGTPIACRFLLMPKRLRFAPSARLRGVRPTP